MKKKKIVKGFAIYGKIKYEIAAIDGLSYSARIMHRKYEELAMFHFAKEYFQRVLDHDDAVTDKKKKLTHANKAIIANGVAASQMMINELYPIIYHKLNKTRMEMMKDSANSFYETAKDKLEEKYQEFKVWFEKVKKGFFRFR